MADEILSGLKGIKKELKAVQDQMAGLDAGSQEFVKLSQRAGELRDRMNDVREAVNANAGPAITSFGNNLSIARGQIMELDIEGFGESMTRMASNVQAVDFKSFKDGLKSMTDGFGNLAKALLSNPIFLIAGAIALIAMNMDKVFKIFPSFEKGLKGIGEQEREIAKAVEARAQASKKAYEQSSLEINQMKLAGKSEREIVEFRMARLKTSIADAKVQLETSVSQAKIQIETAKRNKEILEGILKFINAPITVILDTIDNIGQLVGQDFGLNKKYADFITSFVVDPVQMEEDLNNAIIAQQDALKQMESDYVGFQLNIKEIDKKAAEKKKQEEEKRKKETIDRRKALSDFNAEQDAEDYQMALDQTEQMGKLGQDLTDKERERAIEKTEIAKTAYEELSKIDQEYVSDLLETSDEATQHQIENAKKLRDAEFEKRDKILKLAQEGEAAISDVGAAYFATKMSRIDKETVAGAAAYEALARKQFEFNKKMQLAGAVIDLAKSINASLASSPVAIGAVPNPAGIASLVFASATGLANIAKIAATQYESPNAQSSTSPSPSSGGGAMSAPSAQSPSALNLSFLEGNVNTAPLQTYVLAGQVSNAQQAEFKIKNTASILGGG
jgi:hypothetical protein